MDPLAEYTARRDRFRSQGRLLQKQFAAIGNWRLVTGIGAALLAWFIFVRHSVAGYSLLVPLATFTFLVLWHQRVRRKQTLANRAVRYYDRGLARLRDEWFGTGSSGERYRDAGHVYADDLDLFGKGGLFELISTAHTAAGENMLAQWLLAPARAEEVLLRQEAAVELESRLQLREDIALLAEDLGPNAPTEMPGEWGTAPVVRFPRWLTPVSFVLAAIGLVSLVGFFVNAIGLWLPLAIIVGNSLIIFVLREKVAEVLGSVEASGRDVKIFASLVARLEQESFTSSRLRRLREDLAISGLPASKRIAQLGRLVDWMDSSDHLAVKALRPLLLWQEQLAMAFERWRWHSGKHIGKWINAIAEFECLSSFAALAFERPTWGTPQFLEDRRACFEAVALRHPLIPAKTCVANDLALGGNQRLMVVSGSNMSGKSTLLRAVGLNTVLACAGAVTAARTLRLSVLRTGASIRVNDSLQDHRSRFFAEITKIRQVVDLIKSGEPVLFLLDELLSGTNSHDRRIGASGIVRELLRSQAIGLITTHDLALAQIEQDVASGVVNVHFEDQLNGSEMHFDYRLKPGVVTRSNALELMRAVGLEV